MNISKISCNTIFKSNSQSNTQKTSAEISKTHVFFEILTDKEIEEINKTKLLPKGVRLAADVGRGGQGGYRLIQPPLAKDEQNKLPEGYMVKRLPLGAIRAVKVQ